MRFLILGGSGYLGSKVIYELCKWNHRIVATKRSNSDTSRVLSDSVLWIPANEEAIRTSMLYEKFDWILNMVCNYGRSTVLYDDCIEANLQFPLAILNLAAEFGIENFLTIGTGLPERFNMYSLSKEMFAQFGRFYVDKHRINFTSMKLEIFYGFDEPSGRFIPDVIRRSMENEDLYVTEGTQLRDIVAVDDVLDAILFVISYGPKGYQEIDVGTGEAPSIKEIVEFIHSYAGATSKIHFGAVPMRPDEPNCVADTAALTAMGFRCKWQWKQGLRKMIDEMGGNI